MTGFGMAAASTRPYVNNLHHPYHCEIPTFERDDQQLQLYEILNLHLKSAAAYDSITL